MTRTLPHSRFIRLPYTPRIIYQAPYCSLCCIDLQDAGEVWECPSCGHQWADDADPLAPGAMVHPDEALTKTPVEDINWIPRPGTLQRDQLIRELNRKATK